MSKVSRDAHIPIDARVLHLTLSLRLPAVPSYPSSYPVEAAHARWRIPRPGSRRPRIFIILRREISGARVR